MFLFNASNKVDKLIETWLITGGLDSHEYV